MKRYSLRKTAKLFFPCLLAAGLLLLSGCSSIKVVESWNSPPFQGHRYHKMMIVAIAHDENLREMAENILVQEFRRSGVAAVASHTIVKEIDNARREDIVAAVRSVDADVVLSIRAVSKGSTKITQDGQSGGIYGTSTNVGGGGLPGARSYSLATLQTNLYDSATAALIWSATITTYDAEDAARVSRDLARFFLESIRKEGYF
jgi:hypothetical protein